MFIYLYDHFWRKGLHIFQFHAFLYLIASLLNITFREWVDCQHVLVLCPKLRIKFNSKSIYMKDCHNSPIVCNLFFVYINYFCLIRTLSNTMHLDPRKGVNFQGPQVLFFGSLRGTNGGLVLSQGRTWQHYQSHHRWRGGLPKPGSPWWEKRHSVVTGAVCSSKSNRLRLRYTWIF